MKEFPLLVVETTTADEGILTLAASKQSEPVISEMTYRQDTDLPPILPVILGQVTRSENTGYDYKDLNGMDLRP